MPGGALIWRALSVEPVPTSSAVRPLSSAGDGLSGARRYRDVATDRFLDARTELLRAFQVGCGVRILPDRSPQHYGLT